MSEDPYVIESYCLSWPDKVQERFLSVTGDSCLARNLMVTRLLQMCRSCHTPCVLRSSCRLPSSVPYSNRRLPAVGGPLDLLKPEQLEGRLGSGAVDIGRYPGELRVRQAQDITQLWEHAPPLLETLYGRSQTLVALQPGYQAPQMGNRAALGLRSGARHPLLSPLKRLATAPDELKVRQRKGKRRILAAIAFQYP